MQHLRISAIDIIRANAHSSCVASRFKTTTTTTIVIMLRPLALAVTLSPALAFQLPWNIPFFSTDSHQAPLEIPPEIEIEVANVNIPDVPTTPRIAVIGAGAGGSSAAFWLNKAKERFNLDFEIDVFEKEDYIGGRSTVVYPYNDTELDPVELGASIFVAANKNLWRASEEFELYRKDFDEDKETTGMGVWDGEKFPVTVSSGSFWREWWGTVKVILRYGWNSPVKTNASVNKLLEKFLILYAAEQMQWDSIANLSASFEWEYLTAQTMAEYLDSESISPKFTRELVEAATRVNYGQNVDRIHALEGLCSLAAKSASGIKGGNFKIFEQFLERSGANVHLNTAVSSIVPSSKSGQWTLTTSSGVSTDYTGIILAAPYHTSSPPVSLPTSLGAHFPTVPYVHLHVTLLTTTSPSPNSTYFNLPSSEKVPRSVLTTYEGARLGGSEPEFNSLTYHGEVAPGRNEWVVKIFSDHHLSDEWLEQVFDGNVGWVYRKEWDAYPRLPPTTTYPPVKVEDGFYYVNAFEPFISTMETETISARNVVDLLLDEKFGSGICGSRVSASLEEVQEPSAATTAENAEAEQVVFQAPPEAPTAEAETAEENKETETAVPEPEPEVIGVTTGQVKEEKPVPKEFVYGWDCP